MATQVKRSQYGFKLENIEPNHDPAWQLAGPRGQRAYWLEAARVGHAIKVASILKGLGRDGGAVRDISAYTRAHRRSAMTPGGHGNPAAPPLTPGGPLSRAASYLRAIVLPDGVWFQWRWDRRLGMSWGQIMSYQARRGRDMIGFSLADWDAIVERMDIWWARNRQRLALQGAALRGFRPVAAPAPVAPILKPRLAIVAESVASPKPLVSRPLAGLTIAPADAKRVRTAAEAGTFSGWRRGPGPAEPGSYRDRMQATLLSIFHATRIGPTRKKA